MEIRTYQPEDRAATADFSARLQQHFPAWSFEPPETTNATESDEPSRLEMIVARDDQGVHGGYTMRVDHYWLDGEQVRLHYFGFPISEGVFDRKFATLGLRLQRDIQQRTQLAYGLGGGGMQSQVNQLKIRGGWAAADVPFWIYANRPARVLKQLPLLQRKKTYRIIATVLANSGVASLGGGLVNALRNRVAVKLAKSLQWEAVSSFPNCVDSIYEQSIAHYRLIARRDRVVLDRRFPSNLPHLQRVVVFKEGKPIGWFVAIDRVFNKEQHFGNLRVGFLVDCLALPEFAGEVIASATDCLRQMDVDLIVCNASHTAWNSALRACGFWRAPSNFPFLASPKLAQCMTPLPNFLADSHVMRADGDYVRAMLPVVNDNRLDAKGPIVAEAA